MKLHRRRVLELAAGVGALPVLSPTARAQTYPSRPVRLIVPIPAGGSPDIVARLLGQYLSERLGQPFVVENRPGASTNLGTEYVLRAPADGYTLLETVSSGAINASLYPNLSFNFIRDTAPIARIATIPLIMAVHPSFPARTVPDFIAYAKANPGKINIAAPGIGTPLHVAGELFKMMAGVDMTDISYRGETLAMPDLISGQVQVMFAIMSTSLGYIKDGRLRALAVTTAKRQEALPDVPAVAEFLPGYEAIGWYGIVAQRALTAEIVDKLNREINIALADPDVKKRLTDLGYVVAAGTPGDFATFIADETEKWAKVVKFADIKPE
jgi:tripartite-type tricarboxylate transporter receptor subunit TctC